MLTRDAAIALLNDLDGAVGHDQIPIIEAAFAKAIAKEREACARICDDCLSASASNPIWDACRAAIAEEIRSRSTDRR
jgi:hypothetical protein